LRGDIAAADDDEILLAAAHKQLALVEEAQVARAKVLAAVCRGIFRTLRRT
jgi:hypothetical protein